LLQIVLPALDIEITDKLDNIHNADIEMHSNSAAAQFYVIYYKLERIKSTFKETWL